MRTPRILAAVRPHQRQKLAPFKTVIVTRSTAETFETLEEHQPGSTNFRRRIYDGMKFIARPAGRGWLAVYVRSDTDAIYLKMAFDEETRTQPNPNVAGSEGTAM